MKKKATVLILAIAGIIFCLRPPAASAATSVSVSFFYDELSPYGRWSTVGGYGDCWIPEHVAAGWQPYTDGEWAYTDYGWTWISYDPWGADPYHYGTWVWEPPYGWVWIPGTVWGPAWVTWCYSDAYIGWAPIPPTLAISFSGYMGPPVIVSHTQYVFVPTNRFVGVRVSSARLPVQQNATLLQRTQKVTSFSVSKGIVVNRGPSVDRIEAAAHVRIPRASIDVAKSRPMSLTAGGAVRGHQLSVVSPAPVRARAMKEHVAAGGGATAGGAVHGNGKAKGSAEGTVSPRSEGGATGTGHGRSGSPPRHEAAPRHESSDHHEAKSHHEPPPHHEAQSHHEPPPHHVAPPPPREEPPPTTRHEPPPHHEAPPHQPPPPSKRPPPHHEPPPPPPPGGLAAEPVTSSGAAPVERGDMSAAHRSIRSR